MDDTFKTVPTGFFFNQIYIIHAPVGSENFETYLQFMY
jgi:hypothetical protein